MEHIRLDFLVREAPDLVELVRAADTDQLRRCAIAVAELALETNDLAQFVPIAAQDRAVLERERDAAEAEYWHLHGGDDAPGQAPGTRQAFDRERALTAACDALLPDARLAAANSIYEALFAGDDRSKVVELAARFLRS